MEITRKLEWSSTSCTPLPRALAPAVSLGKQAPHPCERFHPKTDARPTRSPIGRVLLPLLLVVFVTSSPGLAQQEKPKQAARSEEETSPTPVTRTKQPPVKKPEPEAPQPATPDESKGEAAEPLKVRSPDAQPPKPSAKPAPKETGPEVVLGGYCPVAYQLLGKATKGTPEHQSTFVGEIYYFHSAEAKAKFDENPGKYLPQFGGLCTLSFGGMYGNRLWADPTVFEVVDGKLYLFWNERAKRAYEKDPKLYRDVAAERFVEPALEGHCSVAYQTRNKAFKGQPILSTVYKGWVYYLSNEQALNAFRTEPARYAPQYRGYCAEGVSRNKRFKSDPTQFAVRNNKTYLFFDVKAKLEFRARSELMIPRADANWETLKDENPL